MLSVVIPARDAAATLGRALASASGADEIVVVDDGSTDATAAIARAAGAVVVAAAGGEGAAAPRPAAGAAAARNAGVAAARGDLIVFLDADDELLVPDPRPALLADADVAIGATEVTDADGAVTHPGAIIWGIAGLAIRRAAFETVGPFATEREPAEDLDWILRARDAGLRFASTEAVVYRYRRRTGSFSDGRLNQGFVGALRASVVRGRA